MTGQPDRPVDGEQVPTVEEVRDLLDELTALDQRLASGEEVPTVELDAFHRRKNDLVDRIELTRRRQGLTR